MPYHAIDFSRFCDSKKNGTALGLLTLPEYQRAQFIFSGVALKKLAFTGES